MNQENEELDSFYQWTFSLDSYFSEDTQDEEDSGNAEEAEAEGAPKSRFENLTEEELKMASENFASLVDILPEVERDFLADVAKKLCKTHKYNKIGLGDWILDNVGKSNLPKRRDGIKVSSVGNEDACREDSETWCTCACCFADTLGEDEVVSCADQHKFCQECIFGAAQVALSEGKATLNCLAHCGSQFSNIRINEILPEEFALKWNEVLLRSEIEKVQIEGLVKCPFCPYAEIFIKPEDSLSCLNPKCMKTSCTKCQRESHAPAPCEGSDRDSFARQVVEEAMSEALIRKCPTCGIAYVKSDGCHHITCLRCRGQSCYQCGKMLSDGTHSECQASLDQLHRDAVLQRADEAKRNLLESGVELKFDPSKDF